MYPAANRVRPPSAAEIPAHPPTPVAPPMRFGAFAITETSSFPPPAAAECWVYVTLNAEIALSLPESAALQQLVVSPRVRISVDGQWLWWALRRKYPGEPLRKLAGSDLIHDLARHCAQQGLRLLLLGASASTNELAVQRLRERWAGLQVRGHVPGHYTPGEVSEARMRRDALAAIDAWRPDFVVLGLGAAKEHRFAWQNANRLDGRVQGLLCFGGAIDLASGTVRRAPLHWQRCGLEGAWRVWQQPSRWWRLLRVLRVLPVLARGAY